MALGLFIGFILPVGLQTLPALALAFLLKANKVLTWTFTCISNPATVFILYPIQCYTGSLLILHPLNYTELSEKFGAIISADGFRESCSAFASLGWDIIVTFFVGGLFYGTILGFAGYWTGKCLVTLYRKQREQRRLKRERLRLQRENGKQRETAGTPD